MGRNIINREKLPLPNRNLYDLMMDKTNGNISAFADLIGVSQQVLDRTFREQSNGKYPSISDKIKDGLKKEYGIDDKWLYAGNDSVPSSEIAEPTGTYNRVMKNDYETFLLPQSAMGGSLSGFPADGVTLQNCEKIISPIKGVDFAISVNGDSMSPEYPSGSRILIKKIDPSIFIEWGKVYVLDTINGVVVKELHKNDKDGYVTCHSLNPDPKFADFEVEISKVYGFYRVLMCLSAK